MRVIINQRSGNLPGGGEHIVKLLQRPGLEVRLDVCESDAQLVQMATRLAREDDRLIVAGGGDGTLNAVAAPLIGTDKVFGILPLGTFNHFAKDLRIPLDLAEAVKVIHQGYTTRVDVGRVNDHYFLNNSSIGIYSTFVRRRKRQEQLYKRSKWRAFWGAALTLIGRYPVLDLYLTAHQQELSRRTPFLFVGNNQYQWNGPGIGQRSQLDQGHLSIFIAHPTSRWGLIRLAWRALFGALQPGIDCDAFLATEARIQTRRNHIHVAADGEVFSMKGATLHYQICPRALEVIIPNPQSPST